MNNLKLTEPFNLLQLHETLLLSQKEENVPIHGIDIEVDKTSLTNFSQKDIVPDRDVHVYDTKIESNPNEIIPNYTDEQKKQAKDLLESILKLIGPQKNPYVNGALQMLQILNTRHVNIDPVNKIDIDNLLADIVFSTKFTFCIFNLFVEQIADNGILGTCLQGSTIRYIQIWRLLYD